MRPLFGRGTRPLRLALLLLAVSLGACSRGSASTPQIDVSWALKPLPPVIGPATLAVTLRGTDRLPVRSAKVRLEAFMSHPGMAPVSAAATEAAPGVYEMSFAFTMRGDWVLVVSGVLPRGGQFERRIDVANVQPSK